MFFLYIILKYLYSIMKYIKNYRLFESDEDDSDDITGEDNDEIIGDFVSNDEWLDLLDWNWVVDYYEKENGKPKETFDDMITYLNPWDYVDDKKFIEDQLSDIADSESSDFRYQYNTDRDRTKTIIPYLEKEIFYNFDTEEKRNNFNKDLIDRYIKYSDQEIEDYDDEDDISKKEEFLKDTEERVKNEGSFWILEELDIDEVLDIFEDYVDLYYFTYSIVEDRYSNTTAYEYLSEFYPNDELDDYESFFNNHTDYKWYVDEKEMEEDSESEWDDDTIKNGMEKLIDTEYDIQLKIFKENEKRIFDMLESDIVCKELASNIEFQDKYFELILDEKEEISIKDVEKITDLGVDIEPSLGPKYDIEYILGGKDIGLY